MDGYGNLLGEAFIAGGKISIAIFTLIVVLFCAFGAGLYVGKVDEIRVDEKLEPTSIELIFNGEKTDTTYIYDTNFLYYNED